MEDYLNYKVDEEFLAGIESNLKQEQEDLENLLKNLVGIPDSVKNQVMETVRTADEAKLQYCRLREELKCREAAILRRERAMLDRRLQRKH